jgi:hypothetical protein
MAGLQLMGSAGFSGSGGGLPVAANNPTGTTISQQAFGVSSGLGTGPRTAGYGTLIAGAAGAALLAWLWWTLPR